MSRHRKRRHLPSHRRFLHGNLNDAPSDRCFPDREFILQPARLVPSPQLVSTIPVANMADAAHVKPEPDADSSAAINAPAYDDDLYEDAGDLEFYGDSGGELNSENLYLARVPKYIWDAWMKMTERLGDDDQIQIGTMRTWYEEQPNGGSQVCSLDLRITRHCLTNCRSIGQAATLA